MIEPPHEPWLTTCCTPYKLGGSLVDHRPTENTCSTFMIRAKNAPCFEGPSAAGVRQRSSSRLLARLPHRSEGQFSLATPFETHSRVNGESKQVFRRRVPYFLRRTTFYTTPEVLVWSKNENRLLQRQEGQDPLSNATAGETCGACAQLPILPMHHLVIPQHSACDRSYDGRSCRISAHKLGGIANCRYRIAQRLTSRNACNEGGASRLLYQSKYAEGI